MTHYTRIIVISTHSETGGRIPRIDKAMLKDTYGQVIFGFCEVDNKTGGGVNVLKNVIYQAASQLPQMGDKLSKTWITVRDKLINLALPYISYKRYIVICNDDGLNKTEAGALIELMHDLGAAVYYGEDSGLNNTVVLQAEWLTKAIGYVLEDRGTYERYGELPHENLHEIWYDHNDSHRVRYEPSLHRFFLRLMEKYDVSYRLGEGFSSIVAQLVRDVRPQLPWHPDHTPVSEGEAQISLVCDMDEDPPGLVPWTIVRTHQFASVDRLHWKNGTFLDNGVHGSAVLEYKNREFLITVRAKWPNYLMSILKYTIEQLASERWPGLNWNISVPCPEYIDNKKKNMCKGRFPLDTLYTWKSRRQIMFLCPQCSNEIDLDGILIGFNPPSSKDCTNIDFLRKDIENLRSETAFVYRSLMRAIFSEADENCPRLFTLAPTGSSKKWMSGIEKVNHRLTLWCEMPDCQHPVCIPGSGNSGDYSFSVNREWFKKIAPYASLIASILTKIIPISTVLMDAAFNINELENM